MTRTPPHNLEAEKAVIGIALVNLETAHNTPLQPEHFYNPHHQIIWQTIQQADSHRYRQLGNAIAVPVAKWVAGHLMRILQ